MRLQDIVQGHPVMKMHGTGNDFLVFPDFDERLTKEQAIKLCDRHFGMGADGIIEVVKAKNADASIGMKIFNSNGSIAEMCGNGIRCLAKYVVDFNLLQTGETLGEMAVGTGAGIIRPNITSYSHGKAVVKVNMGEPKLNVDENIDTRGLDYVSLRTPVRVNFRNEMTGFQGTYVNMGNPHIVFFVGKGKAEELAEKYGSKIENRTETFPNRINVEFVEAEGPNDLTVHVWERGAGKTLACGTGACASLVASVLDKYIENYATVHMPGGNLEVSWSGRGSSVYMTGEAVNVGEIDARSLDRYILAEAEE